MSVVGHHLQVQVPKEKRMFSYFWWPACWRWKSKEQGPCSFSVLVHIIFPTTTRRCTQLYSVFFGFYGAGAYGRPFSSLTHCLQLFCDPPSRSSKKNGKLEQVLTVYRESEKSRGTQRGCSPTGMPIILSHDVLTRTEFKDY